LPSQPERQEQDLILVPGLPEGVEVPDLDTGYGEVWDFEFDGDWDRSLEVFQNRGRREGMCGGLSG